MITTIAIDLICFMVALGFVWFIINSWVYENHPKLLKPIFYSFIILTIITIIFCTIAFFTQ